MIPSLFEDAVLIHGILSRPAQKNKDTKLTVTPLEIKGKKVFQFTRFSGNQAFHQNYNGDEAKAFLINQLDHFKEAHFYTEEADFLGLKDKSGNWRWIKSKPTKNAQKKTHNRLKNYILDEASNAQFWKALGIAGEFGKIKPQSQAKFRQVNRFIEIVASILSDLPTDRAIQIIDFGCGKAYLTFALYHYLVKTLGLSVQIIGIDLKESVVKHLNQIKEDLQYDTLQFYVGDIKTFSLPNSPIDLVVSLHACDTATDHVISRFVASQANVLLSVPCCQHALYKKIKQTHLDPLFKHGILKERFSALATDALRACFLEKSGYQTQIIEFVDTEHTPKNLMIKAVKSNSLVGESKDQEYENFLSYLQLKPFI